MNSKQVTMRSARESFLLLKPNPNARSSHEIARAIAVCKGVRQVHLTSGNYGFVVSVKADSKKGMKVISSAVKRATKTRYVGAALGHFTYR